MLIHSCVGSSIPGTSIMKLFIYIYTHTWTRSHTRTYTHTHTHTHTHTYTLTHIYIRDVPYSFFPFVHIYAGPDWKILTGAGQPAVNPKSSPGYNHAVHWPK